MLGKLKSYGILIILVICTIVIFLAFRAKQVTNQLNEHAARIWMFGPRTLMKSDSSLEFQPHMKFKRISTNNKVGYAYVDDNGTIMGSWRFYACAIECMGGCSNLLELTLDIHKSWNDSKNIKIRDPVYCWNTDDKSKNYYDTNVIALCGSDTAFDMLLQGPVDISRNRNLIVLMEIHDSNVFWSNCGDIDIDHLPEHLLDSPNSYGTLVYFLDGEVWLISKRTPIELLKKFFTAESARKHDKMTELLPYSKIIHSETLIGKDKPQSERSD